MPATAQTRKKSTTIRPPAMKLKKNHGIVIHDHSIEAVPVDMDAVDIAEKDDSIPPPSMDSPAPSKEEIHALWESFRESQARVIALAERMNNAQNIRSGKIRNIAERMGKGPFSFEEKILQIRKRGDRWFFVEIGNVHVTTID